MITLVNEEKLRERVSHQALDVAAGVGVRRRATVSNEAGMLLPGSGPGSGPRPRGGSQGARG